MSEIQDIKNIEDIEVVLRDFYPAAFEDPIIGFMFTDVANADIDEHIINVSKFWNMALFREGGYSTNVLKKHTDLNATVALKSGHFVRWLYLFEKAVDANFAGENAEAMKKNAHKIAESIHSAVSGLGVVNSTPIETL